MDLASDADLSLAKACCNWLGFAGIGVGLYFLTTTTFIGLLSGWLGAAIHHFKPFTQATA